MSKNERKLSFLGIINHYGSEKYKLLLYDTKKP